MSTVELSRHRAWLCGVPNLMLAIWFTRRPADVVNAA